MALVYTIDHEEIRKWIEEHNGEPAIIQGTGGDDRAGTLFISFGETSRDINLIGWREFFDIFERRNLRFHYETETMTDAVDWEYGFDDRDTPTNGVDDETRLPDEVDDVDENMFPSAGA
jgi:hypothetical protein